MKKFELNVVNFDNEDVIATSCDKDPIELDFGRNSYGGALTIDQVNGKKIELDGTVYNVYNSNLYQEGSYTPLRVANTDAANAYDGIYHLEDDGVYTFCEDGCNEAE